MVKNYIIGVLVGLTVIIIPKLFDYFIKNIKKEMDVTIRGLQISITLTFIIYSYLIFNSEIIHKFILGLLLIITIIGWIYLIPKEIYKLKSKKSSIYTNKFPYIPWLTAKDVMKEYGLSVNKLKQHIENGLPGYIKNPENQDLRQINKDRDLIALEEWEEESGNMIDQWLFKTEDVKKYIKT